MERNRTPASLPGENPGAATIYGPEPVSPCTHGAENVAGERPARPPNSKIKSGRDNPNMGDVVELQVETTVDIPADKVCGAAAHANLKKAIVVGYDQEDKLYLASTTSDLAEVLWLLENAKLSVLKD